MPPLTPIIHTTADLHHHRTLSQARLKQTWEGIFTRFSHDFTGIADEIDGATGELIVDNGHLRSLASPSLSPSSTSSSSAQTQDQCEECRERDELDTSPCKHSRHEEGKKEVGLNLTREVLLGWRPSNLHAHLMASFGESLDSADLSFQLQKYDVDGRSLAALRRRDVKTLVGKAEVEGVWEEVQRLQATITHDVDLVRVPYKGRHLGAEGMNTEGIDPWAPPPRQSDPFYSASWCDEHPDGTPAAFAAGRKRSREVERRSTPPRKRVKMRVGTPRSVQYPQRKVAFEVAIPVRSVGAEKVDGMKGVKAAPKTPGDKIKANSAGKKSTEAVPGSAPAKLQTVKTKTKPKTSGSKVKTTVALTPDTIDPLSTPVTKPTKSARKRTSIITTSSTIETLYPLKDQDNIGPAIPDSPAILGAGVEIPDSQDSDEKDLTIQETDTKALDVSETPDITESPSTPEILSTSTTATLKTRSSNKKTPFTVDKKSYPPTIQTRTPVQTPTGKKMPIASTKKTPSRPTPTPTPELEMPSARRISSARPQRTVSETRSARPTTPARTPKTPKPTASKSTPAKPNSGSAKKTSAAKKSTSKPATPGWTATVPMHRLRGPSLLGFVRFTDDEEVDELAGGGGGQGREKNGRYKDGNGKDGKDSDSGGKDTAGNEEGTDGNTGRDAMGGIDTAVATSESPQTPDTPSVLLRSEAEVGLVVSPSTTVDSVPAPVEETTTPKPVAEKVSEVPTPVPMPVTESATDIPKPVVEAGAPIVSETPTAPVSISTTETAEPAIPTEAPAFTLETPVPSTETSSEAAVPTTAAPQPTSTPKSKTKTHKCTSKKGFCFVCMDLEGEEDDLI